MKRNRVIFVDRGRLPVYIGFCPSRRAWEGEVKRLNLHGEDAEYPRVPPGGGCVVGYESRKGGADMVMVFLSENVMKAKEPIVIGVIAHESWHVWGKTLKYIGERNQPTIGDEIGAYNMQRIVQELYLAYLKTRPTPCRAKGGSAGKRVTAKSGTRRSKRR